MGAREEEIRDGRTVPPFFFSFLSFVATVIGRCLEEEEKEKERERKGTLAWPMTLPRISPSSSSSSLVRRTRDPLPSQPRTALNTRLLLIHETVNSDVMGKHGLIYISPAGERGEGEAAAAAAFP